MSAIKKRAFRPYAFFLLPESEREEPFLNEMSQSGWHLIKTSYWCYTFQKGEPTEYQYRMDFVSKNLGRAEYMQLLQDAGWEVVDTRRDELGLWAYCRKPRSEVYNLELYTDAESKVELARRIRKAFWRMAAASFVVFALLGAFGIWQGGDWGALIGGLSGGAIGTIGGGILVWRKVKRNKQDKL